MLLCPVYIAVISGMRLLAYKYSYAVSKYFPSKEKTKPFRCEAFKGKVARIFF
jgi:hypothetical protein